MFTQLNQYHVVLEVKPGFQKNPSDLRNLFIRTGAAARGSSGWWRADRRRALDRTHQLVIRRDGELSRAIV